VAGVGQAYDAQSAAAADALRGQGLDPKAIGSRLDSSVRTQRAASQAGGGNQEVLNRQIAGQTMLGQAIGLGQADAALTNQFGGVGLANRNQAVNTGTALTQTGSMSRGGPQQWGTMGATQLKEWPKAELDAMRAQNEQGALWNDINRTNMAREQMAGGQGSGWGAAAGGGLGALSSMFSFSPMKLNKGGVVPHYAWGGPVDPADSGGGGGMAIDPNAIMSMMGSMGQQQAAPPPQIEIPRGSTWRKFAYGNPIADPQPLLEEGAGVAQQPVPKGPRGKSPFQFDLGGAGGVGEVFNAGPQGSGPGGEYTTADTGYGGILSSLGGGVNSADSFGNIDMEIADWSGYRKGGVVKRGAINTGPRVKKYAWGGYTQPSTTDSIEAYTRKAGGMDPSGYAGFATDAFALGRDIWDPTATETEVVPGDQFGITGPWERDAGEQIGGDVGRPIGRAIGAIWGMPGVGAMAGEDIGTGVGAMVQGRWGEGFENLGRGALNRFTGLLGQAGKGMMGGMGGGGGNLAGGAITDTGSWGGMGGMDMGGMDFGGSGFTFAQGGAVPDSPLGRLRHYIDGGAVTGPVTPQFQGGGMQPGAIQTGQTVPPTAQVPGIPGPDNVPAMVAEGEGILPQDVMKWRGEQWMQKEIMKARKEMESQRVAAPEEGATPPEAIQTGPTFASEGALT
jgi:hypothetical protein